MVGMKELDAQLRRLQAQIVEEENDWREEERKLYEFEEKYLRDTHGEGNMIMGWGDPKSAPVRFRNAQLRKRKKEKQGATINAIIPSAPLSAEDQFKLDRHRYASYSSITSPAEPLYADLDAREQLLITESKAKKPKK